MTSALQMVQMIRDGETTSVALVTAALDRIAETDDALKAWVWLDRDGALGTGARQWINCGNRVGRSAHFMGCRLV